MDGNAKIKAMHDSMRETLQVWEADDLEDVVHDIARVITSNQAYLMLASWGPFCEYLRQYLREGLDVVERRGIV